MKYPNGQTFKPKNTIHTNTKHKLHNAANRGMSLEEDINLSNRYYLEKNICLIQKRPTPIKVVRVDYAHGCKITDAYFEKQSTTDYNGLYKGRYVDFEAKNTLSRTSFPLANICKHQIEHLKRVINHNGIAFFIIRFQTFNETYLLDANYIIDFYNTHTRKSIPYESVKQYGHVIEQKYMPRLDYIKIIEKIYFIGN